MKGIGCLCFWKLDIIKEQMAKIFSLEDNINDVKGFLEGENFRKMLDLCFSKATTFSLSKQIRPEFTCDVERLLLPYKIKELYAKDWFGYWGMSAPIHVIIYQANKNTKKILQDHYEEIFLRKLINDYPRKQSSDVAISDAVIFEDLCFFCDKRMFLGTVSHEAICEVDLSDAEFKEEVLRLAKWKMRAGDPCGMLKDHY